MTSLPEGLICAVRERLSEGKRLRRTLPDSGRIHIDRQLPFLVVYRRPDDREDPGTQRLVLGQASYLTISGDEASVEPSRHLVGTIAETLSDVFGAFLVVEIWTAAAPPDGDSASFARVVSPDQQGSLDAVDELVKALSDLGLPDWQPDVRPVNGKTAAPPGMPPLLEPQEANRLNCYMVGVALDPVFRDPNGNLYPEVLRRLSARITMALQRALFVFAREKTSAELTSSLGLGRRAPVRAVGRVDSALGDLCGSFDFLLDVTPVNSGAAWDDFKDSGFRTEPTFHYRPITTDPEILLRKLYAVPLEEVEDPTLDRLFRPKVREVGRQLTMLAERNTHRFSHGSLRLYGGVEDELLDLAEALLATIPDDDSVEQRTVDAEAFAELVRDEFERYRGAYEAFDADFEIRDDISGLVVSKGNVLIDQSIRLGPTRAHALLQHEVGTHVLSYVNGRRQPLEIFHTGLAGYEVLQEGLAVLSEYLVGGLTRRRLRLLAARVVAVERMVRGANFVEIFEELAEEYGLVPGTAFRTTMRVVRGGGLTKDAVYLRGLKEVVGYLRDGGEVELLFLGKISLPHVETVEELLARGVLREAPLRPTCLADELAGNRLAEIRDGKPIAEMYERTD